MAAHDATYISSQQLKWIVEHGGKERFYCGWYFYKDSPYAIYARRLESMGIMKPEIKQQQFEVK